MKKLVLGTFLSALAMFVFGAGFWMSPFPYSFAAKAPGGDEALGRALKASLPTAGLYLVPSVGGDTEKELALYKAGPVATIHFRPEGVDSMSPSVMIRGFLLGWTTTALLALMLRLGMPSTYGARVLAVLTAAAAAAAYIRLGDGIWWFQPWPWLVLTAVYDVAAFGVGALVLAAFVKPQPR
jgi:hypothetical protein